MRGANAHHNVLTGRVEEAMAVLCCGMEYKIITTKKGEGNNATNV